MLVTGYDFNTRALQFERVDLAACFPHDPEALEEARAALERDGEYVSGGGAFHATLLVRC